MFVVRNPEGAYLKVGPTWCRQWTPDLQKARTYPTTGAAKNSATAAKYGRRSEIEFDVVPVQLSLMEKA